MLLTIALTAAAIYAVAGALFAVPFVLRGASALDPAAARGTWSFRLLAAPGAAALWPVMLWKWLATTKRDV